jgi:hypothetical protein
MVRSYAALVTCGFRAPVASVVINENSSSLNSNSYLEYHQIAFRIGTKKFVKEL